MIFVFTVGLICLFFFISLALFSYEFRDLIARLFQGFFNILDNGNARARQSANNAVDNFKNIKKKQFLGVFKKALNEPYLLIGLALTVICLPLIWAWYYTQYGGNSIPIEDFNKNSRYQNNAILNLLAGERLEPPPEVPKELFIQLDAEIASQTASQVDSDYWDNLPKPDFSAAITSDDIGTSEAERRAKALRNDISRGFSGDMLKAHLSRGHINMKNANRNWKKMNSEFVQKLLRVYKIMRDQHGYEMILLEGYRSPQRQNKLLSKGSQVTKAGGYRSYHQFGLAADTAFLKNGKITISEKDPWAMHGYELYGKVAESQGLVWGGRWRMRDLGHVELRKSGVLGNPQMAAKLTQR